MTSQPSGDESRWLLAPLESKEARIFIAVAEDAELSPALRQALEQLAVAMQAEESEVQGYLMNCSGYSCGHFSCDPYACGTFKESSGFGLFSTVGATPLSFGLFSR